MKNDLNHTRTNMFLGVLNGVFFNAAGAFIHGGTVIPLFISGLTNSKILVGVFSTLETFGWSFPQLFSGAVILGSPSVLWLYNRMSIVRVFSFLTLLAFVFAVGNSNHLVLLLAFGIAFAAYSLSGGIAGLPFMEIVGKTIPNNKRGTFFGLRMFFGGIIAVIAGPIVKQIIAAYNFPTNFGYLYVIAFIFIVFGLLTFAFAKEPLLADGRQRRSLNDNFKYAFTLYKNDINIRHLILSRVLSLCFLMAMPFYVLVATQNLGISRALAATYLSFEMTGYLGLNFLWAWLSNRISNKRVMKYATLGSLIPPLIALFSLHKNPGYFIYGLAFFFNGAASSGNGLGFLNYLLEIGLEKDRPILIGMVHTLIAPAAFMSVICGVLIVLLGLKAMFIITLACLIISYFYIGRLKEPSR